MHNRIYPFLVLHSKIGYQELLETSFLHYFLVFTTAVTFTITISFPGFSDIYDYVMQCVKIQNC